MHFSNLLALGAATLAAAAPAAETTQAKKQFAVTNFVFGCTIGCNWYLDVAVEGKGPNHPPVKTPVHCEGSFEDTDYVKCGNVSDTQAIYAYIEKATNQLKLQYEVQKPAETAVYRYYGHKKVYAATSDQADLQKPAFKVKESSATGVA